MPSALLPDSQVTLHPLPTLTPATPLSKAKAAFSFATYSAVQNILPDGKMQHSADGAFDKAKAIPTLLTQLAVGCRRKIVIYSWRDGEAQDMRVWPSFFEHALFYLVSNNSARTGSPTTAFATRHVIFRSWHYLLSISSNRLCRLLVGEVNGD